MRFPPPWHHHALTVAFPGLALLAYALGWWLAEATR